MSTTKVKTNQYSVVGANTDIKSKKITISIHLLIFFQHTYKRRNTFYSLTIMLFI